MVSRIRIVLATDPYPGMMAAFGFSHVVCGVVLGATVAFVPV